MTGDETELPNSAEGEGPSERELSLEAAMWTLLLLLWLLTPMMPGCCSSSGVMFSGIIFAYFSNYMKSGI